MHTLLKKFAALVLAVAMVVPGVYIVFEPEPEPVHAFNLNINWGDALVSGVAGYTTCTVAGWATGLLDGVMTAIGALFGMQTNPPTQSVKTANANMDVTSTVGPNVLGVGTPVQSGINPLLIEGIASAGLAAAFTTHVPTSDPFLQQQNYLLSQQIASNQKLNAATADGIAQIAAHEATDVAKECMLDPFAIMLRDIVVDAVTDSIVAWIKGGFNGQPTFVEDPENFFRNIGETAVSAYLYESGLDEILCEPFSLDVILGISWDFYMPDMDPQYGQLSCGLDEVFPGFDVTIGVDGSGNPITVPGYTAEQGYEAMLEDGNIDFPGGGFPAVMAMMADKNNPVGARFETQSAAAAFTGEQVRREATLLDQGDGWFSPRCDIDSNPETARTVCTPGEYVAEHVNEWSDGQLERLQLADEFAEIVNALLQLLIETVLSDGNNLLQESFRR